MLYIQSTSLASGQYNRIKDAWDYPSVQSGIMERDHVEKIDLVHWVIALLFTFVVYYQQKGHVLNIKHDYFN